MQKIKSNKITAITFIIIFTIFVVLGNLLNGEYEPLNIKGFYAFFYYTIPKFLGLAAGLPVGGIIGKIYTLIASAVLFVMSFKMTNIYNKDGIFDYIGGMMSYGLCYIFFTVASSVMIDNSLVNGFLTHKFLLIFPIMFLIIAILLTVLRLGKENYDFWQRLNYMLSCLGFAVAIAGFSSLILSVGAEEIVVIPSRIAALFVRLSGICGTSIFQGILLMLIQAATAVTALFFLYLAGERIRKYYMYSGLLTMILFWCYSPLADTNVIPQGLKYWVMLLVTVCVYAKYAKADKLSCVKTVISSLGLMITLPSLYYSLVFFYEPIDSSFNMVLERILPIKTALLGLVNNIFPFEASGLDMNPIAMVVVTDVIAIVAVLLYLPLKGKKDAQYYLFDNPHNAIVCALVFLVGVLVRSCGFNHHIILKIAYVLIAGSAIAGICLLCASIKLKYKKIVVCNCYAFVVTLILALLCSCFAQGVGIVLAALALGIMVIMTIRENAESKETKADIAAKRAYNMAAYSDAIDQLNEQIASGEKSYDDAKRESIAAAAIALENDQALKESLDNFDSK